MYTPLSVKNILKYIKIKSTYTHNLINTLYESYFFLSQNYIILCYIVYTFLIIISKKQKKVPTSII